MQTNITLMQHIDGVDSARCDEYTQYAVRTLSVTKEVAIVRNVPAVLDLVEINIINVSAVIATSSFASCVETQQNVNPKS